MHRWQNTGICGGSSWDTDTVHFWVTDDLMEILKNDIYCLGSLMLPLKTSVN